jgi:hypothetical protein
VDRTQTIEEWAMNSSVKEFRNSVGGRRMVPTGDEMPEMWNQAAERWR